VNVKASQMHAELCEEHAQLRAMIDVVRRMTRQPVHGPGPREALRGSIVQLADALRRHNLREEELLGGIIPTVDAWGPVRAEIMDHEHIAEHKELYAALLGEDGQPVDALLDRVLDHMAREEAAFLNEDVLRDDVVVTDYFGG
jgi:hypothetical protein